MPATSPRKAESAARSTPSSVRRRRPPSSPNSRWSVHCPEWLGAQVKPKGDRGGGYPYLIETEDFTVKVAGDAQTMWPGLYVELRSHFLHAHPGGAKGACEEALCWVRDTAALRRQRV